MEMKAYATQQLARAALLSARGAPPAAPAPPPPAASAAAHPLVRRLRSPSDAGVAASPLAHAGTQGLKSVVSAPRARARLNDCDLLITVLECYMSAVIRRNERKERIDAVACMHDGRAINEPSVFHALQAPSITAVEYLRRLARYAFCSRSVFIAAFCLLRRVGDMRDVKLAINSLSVHRLLLTAVLVATKVIDDVLYDNAHFAKVGGLDVKELNMLELDMLKVLDFRTYISVEEFESFERLVLDMALNTTDQEYAMLPGRLLNLGYVPVVKAAPASPTSSMDVTFRVD